MRADGANRHLNDAPIVNLEQLEDSGCLRKFAKETRFLLPAGNILGRVLLN